MKTKQITDKNYNEQNRSNNGGHQQFINIQRDVHLSQSSNTTTNTSSSLSVVTSPVSVSTTNIQGIV